MYTSLVPEPFIITMAAVTQELELEELGLHSGAGQHHKKVASFSFEISPELNLFSPQPIKVAKVKSEKFCDLCNFSGFSQVEMKKHKLTHSQSVAACEECDKVCANEKGLKLHMTTMHPKTKVGDQLVDGGADDSALLENSFLSDFEEEPAATLGIQVGERLGEGKVEQLTGRDLPSISVTQVNKQSNQSQAKKAGIGVQAKKVVSGKEKKGVAEKEKIVAVKDKKPVVLKEKNAINVKNKKDIVVREKKGKTFKEKKDGNLGVNKISSGAIVKEVVEPQRKRKIEDNRPKPKQKRSTPLSPPPSTEPVDPVLFPPCTFSPCCHCASCLPCLQPCCHNPPVRQGLCCTAPAQGCLQPLAPSCWAPCCYQPAPGDLHYSSVGLESSNLTTVYNECFQREDIAAAEIELDKFRAAVKTEPAEYVSEEIGMEIEERFVLDTVTEFLLEDSTSQNLEQVDEELSALPGRVSRRYLAPSLLPPGCRVRHSGCPWMTVGGETGPATGTPGLTLLTLFEAPDGAVFHSQAGLLSYYHRKAGQEQEGLYGDRLLEHPGAGHFLLGPGGEPELEECEKEEISRVDHGGSSSVMETMQELEDLMDSSAPLATEENRREAQFPPMAATESQGKESIGNILSNVAKMSSVPEVKEEVSRHVFKSNKSKTEVVQPSSQYGIKSGSGVTITKVAQGKTSKVSKPVKNMKMEESGQVVEKCSTSLAANTTQVTVEQPAKSTTGMLEKAKNVKIEKSVPEKKGISEIKLPKPVLVSKANVLVTPAPTTAAPHLLSLTPSSGPASRKPAPAARVPAAIAARPQAPAARVPGAIAVRPQPPAARLKIPVQKYFEQEPAKPSPALKKPKLTSVSKTPEQRDPESKPRLKTSEAMRAKGRNLLGKKGQKLQPMGRMRFYFRQVYLYYYFIY